MNQELHSMAVFALVVEYGSFAEAARSMDRAPSAVSAHVSRLEGWFGARLLHRTTRKLALTDAGERLLPSCQAILAAYHGARRLADAMSEQVRGPLRVSAPNALLQSVVIPAVGVVMRAHPALEITLLTSDLKADLCAGEVDVAIRVGRLTHVGLRARRIGTLREVRVSTDGAPDCWIRVPWQQHQVAATTLRVDSVVAARAAVNAGLGWAILPMEPGEEDLVAETPVYAVHGYDAQVPSAVRAFIDALTTPC